MAYHSFMDMKEAMVATFREYLLPELEGLKSGQLRITSEIAAVNKRLDDVNQHLADQSCRIDETNQRIDALHEELTRRIDAVRDDTIHRFDTLNSRIDETNVNIAHLYEVIVRRDEYSAVVIKLNDLTNEVHEIKHRLAA